MLCIHMILRCKGTDVINKGYYLIFIIVVINFFYKSCNIHELLPL